MGEPRFFSCDMLRSVCGGLLRLLCPLFVSWSALEWVLYEKAYLKRDLRDPLPTPAAAQLCPLLTALDPKHPKYPPLSPTPSDCPGHPPRLWHRSRNTQKSAKSYWTAVMKGTFSDGLPGWRGGLSICVWGFCLSFQNILNAMLLIKLLGSRWCSVEGMEWKESSVDFGPSSSNQSSESLIHFGHLLVICLFTPRLQLTTWDFGFWQWMESVSVSSWSALASGISEPPAVVPQNEVQGGVPGIQNTHKRCRLP